MKITIGDLVAFAVGFAMTAGLIIFSAYARG